MKREELSILANIQPLASNRFSRTSKLRTFKLEKFHRP